jgi:hypothetical protein
MSDLFENDRQQQFFNTKPPQNTGDVNSASGTSVPRFRNVSGRENFWKQTEQRFTEQKSEREANIERWGFTLPDDQFLALNEAASTDGINVDDVYKLAASYALSQQFNFTPEEAMKNFDQILQTLYGPSENYRIGKTAFNFIVSKGRTGINTLKMGKLGNELREAEQMGNTESANAVLKQITLLNEENYYNQDPNEKERNFFIRALGAAAESAPFTAYVAGSAFFGSLLAPGIGTAASFLASMDVTRGQEYIALREAGANPETARNVSLISGSVQAALEIFLGNALSIAGGAAKAAGKGLLTDNVTRTLIEKATANAFKNAHGKGLFLKTALRLGGEYAGEMFEEGMEELLQEWVSALALEAANALQEGGVVNYTAEEIWENMKEAFKGGAMASIFLGIQGTSLNAKASINSWRQVKNESEKSGSEIEFVERTKDSEIFKGLSDEDRLGYQKAAYAEGQKRMEREESRIAEELKASAGLGEGYAEQKYTKEGEPIPLGDTYRRRNGRLYTQLDTERGLFKVGDGSIDGKKNLYAHISYTLGDDDTVRISEFKVRNDLDTDKFRREIWGEFTEAFAGLKPIWEPKTTREAEIIDYLEENNPYGKNAGLNYYSKEDTGRVSEARFRNWVIDNFKLHFPQLGNAEHAVMAAEWEHFANMRGASLEEYVDREFGGLDKAFTTDPNRRIDAAMKEGQNVKGAVTFESMARDAKAAIYLSKNADLTTFIHEMGHIYRRRLSGDMLAEAQRLWGVKDGKWTKPQEEQFTEDLERWRREGKAPTPEMQTFFEKFAEFLKKIFNAVSQRAEVSPEIREFFDKLYAGEQARNAAQRARMSQEGRVTAQTGNDTAAGTEAAQKASTARQETAASDAKAKPKENRGNSEKNSAENEKRIEKAKSKWEAADRTIGAEDQITLQTGEVITGHYELGEAGISTPSVDPDANFTQSEGFPVNENGTSMNVGRDYTQGFSQDAALRIAADFDQRGIGIIVDVNGVISSGNNRDISRRIAAKNGTDSKYVNYLKSNPERWGFTKDDVVKYKHPTLYFVVDAPAVYTPLYFDQFNRSGEKSVSPLETAIKMSYLIDRDMINEFSKAIGNYDSIDELYEDTQAVTEIFKSLMKKGIVTENSYPEYVETISIRGKQQERVTSGGKDFLESVMLGAVLNEDSIRSLALAPEIRKRVVQGLAALVDNAALGEYCVVPEINQAVAIAVEVQTNKKKYKSITDYADQTEMDLGQRVSTDIEVELAGRLLEKTEYAFADMMGGLNAVLQEEARGQSDMFGGTSKDDILRRYLGVKARADSIREANNKVIGSETAAGLERVAAAMENAGLARSEADGTLFQLAYQGSPHRFERFDNSHMGSGWGAQFFGYGHNFASKKEVAEWYRKKTLERVAEREVIEDQFSKGYFYEENMPIGEKVAGWLRKKALQRKAGKGQLYEVDIPGDEEMLDWDKPFEEQPPLVQKALKPIMERRSELHKKILVSQIAQGKIAPRNVDTDEWVTKASGEDLYKSTGMGPRATSLWLLENGVKGIRYQDDISRDTFGEDSYSYVIFDDSDINITQTFFQLDDELIEEAAQYDNWREFRDAYEGRSRSIITGKPIAFVSEKDIPIINGEPITTAREWIKENPIGNVETVIGDVEVAPKGIDDSFWHTHYKNKVFVLPAIKAILQEGAFLSELDDFNPENNIRNYYFAAPVALDGERKIVFIRVQQIEEGSKKFYVHEVFTEDEVRAAAPLQEEIDKRKTGSGPNTDSFPVNKPGSGTYAASFPGVKAGNQSDLYRSIINNVLTVNPNARATDAWYRSLWNDAKKIYKDTYFQEEETNRAGELDNRFYNEADRKYLTKALKEFYGIHNDQSLEPAQEEDEAAREEYRRVKRLQHRINTELPNAGSVIGMAAQVRSGRELSSTQYDRLRGFIRKNKRDYRAVFADIMGQEEYLEDLADTKDGEPAGRLANPHPDRLNIKARLKEIANIMRETDPALAKEIEDGTVSYEDPRIAAFEAGVEAEYTEAKAALDALEKETAEDYARLANDAQRRIVAAYERMLAAREEMDSSNERLRRMMDEEREIAKPYLDRRRLDQASYEQALKAYNDLIDLYGRDAEVREAVARREAHASERIRQTGIRRRQRALRELKEIKQRLIRRITRKVLFENVAYDQAETIKAIQRIFEASVFEGINKWIGPRGREILRGVWSQWKTDEEFRNTLIEQILKRKKDGSATAERIKGILDKDWKKITIADKKALYRLLPKTDLINDLALKELAKENRESVQLDIDEHYIDGKVQLIIGEDLKRRIKETLGEELFNRIQNKPLAEWSLVEAEELARIIDKLTVEGKRNEAARKEAKRVLEQEYRDRVLEALEKTGVVINPDDTPEEKARKEEEQNRILKKFAGGKKNKLWNNFFDANLRRFTTAMDGGRKGIFTSLLYWGENDAYNEKQRRITARRIVIDKVMKDNNINLDELYREVKIPALEGQDIDLYEVSGGKVTIDDLLYIMRGYQNEETRNAIMYGNLSNASERNRMDGSIEKAEEFANVGHGRMMAVISFAKEYFAKEENKKFLKLYEAIGADYDSNGERLNKAMIDMFNRPMWRVDNYVPMNRREQNGAENENRVIEDLLGTTKAGSKWVNRGFTIKREKINPAGQRPIELGLYKTWAQSVDSTEHLLAYGPMVQTLNAVFKGYHAGEVRQALKKRWGTAADDRIDMTIAEFANPNPTRQRRPLDNVVRTLRGKTATAYLAWKTSSVLRQLVTSPWPYLQEIHPRDYLAACIEVAAGAGKVNDFIREKSIFMKNRDFDPMVKLIKEAMEKNDNAILQKIDKFNSVGMKGLEWVDWICVAPGWLAVYRRELANVAKEQEAEYQKLLQKYQGSEYADVLPTHESRANRALSEILNEQQQDTEAVARADDAVRRMQPSSRSADIAPLFKERSEVFNVFLQFQMALNVIWQNIRYDLPLAVKEKQIGTIAGMVTGYMMAGICLGMLSEIGNDDDDDEEGKLARRILFYSFTQFTDAVPVIGENVTAMAEALATGKMRYSGQGNLPVLEKGFRGIEKIMAAVREEDPEKKRERFIRAARDMGEAAGIGFGLPVSGTKELGAAAGIGDKDGELDFYWQALFGQRK